MLSESEKKTALKSVLLKTMPGEVADTLLDHAVTRDYARGETIFIQEEPAESIYVVLSGWVKLYRMAQNGSEAIVGIFKHGDSFAEAAAFRRESYPVTAEAATDCRLLQLRAGPLLEMMQTRPELGTAILAATYKHLHDLVEQIEQLKARSGPQRVAEFLLDLCPVAVGACTVTLPFDKALLAGRLGMKPESLSRAFGRLRNAGVHVSREHAAISDVDRLRSYAKQGRSDTLRRAK